jgi:hypothetical protein
MIAGAQKRLSLRKKENGIEGKSFCTLPVSHTLSSIREVFDWLVNSGC